MWPYVILLKYANLQILSFKCGLHWQKPLFHIPRPEFKKMSYRAMKYKGFQAVFLERPK